MGGISEREEGEFAAPSASFSCSWVEVILVWLSLSWAVPLGPRGPTPGKDTLFCPRAPRRTRVNGDNRL